MAERKPPAMGPGRRVVYRPDHSKARGIGGLLLSDQIKDAIRDPAREIARIAAALTPRSDDEGRSKTKGPHMADSYKVDYTPRVVKVGALRNPRVSIRIVNTVPHAAAVEFGSGGARPSARPLGRAGGQVGEFKAVEVD